MGPWPAGRRHGPTTPATTRADRAWRPRNVVDAYRYWRRDAIVADLDARRAPVPRRDRELRPRPQHRHRGAHRERLRRGRGAHRRAAPVEPPRRHGDRPLPARAPPPDVADWRRSPPPRSRGRGVDNLPGARRARDGGAAAALRAAVRAGRAGADRPRPERWPADVSIAQFGSTRSINAGVAAGIAMHAWIRQHADLDGAW